MDADEMKLVSKVRQHRESGYGLQLPPISPRPVPLWWILEGWGGYALGLIAFGALIVIAGWW